MKWKKWLENWDMTSLKINLKSLEMEWKPLTIQTGDEQAALDSDYSLFSTAREIIRRHGRDCGEFTKLGVVVLNQIVRPITAHWHKLALTGALRDGQQRQQFDAKLAILQEQRKKYVSRLANLAGATDLVKVKKTKDS